MIKEQIINTAFDLFSQYGIKSVSMDDVAKAAGISKRTLYESFEDKETLLIEGIDHNTESLGQYLTGLEKEPFNALEVILLFYEEMMKNPRWFNEKFYEDLKKYPKAQQKIEMNKARMGKRCMDLFTRGVKEGVFQEGINFEIMALLVKEQTKMLRPSNVFCKHSITEVYNTILLTFLKGISTEKGRAILDRFDLKQKIEMNKARMGKRCMDLFTRGVKEGVFQEGINFEIMALLVKEQTKMLRPSNVFCKHSITEVYNTILLTFLKGISTEKGRAILDRFDLKQSYDL